MDAENNNEHYIFGAGFKEISIHLIPTAAACTKYKYPTSTVRTRITVTRGVSGTHTGDYNKLSSF